MEMLSQPDVKRPTEAETYAAESVDVWIQYGWRIVRGAEPRDERGQPPPAAVLEFAKRRDDRKARGAPGGKQPAEQTHCDGVDKRLYEQRRRDREGERHLAE